MGMTSSPLPPHDQPSDVPVVEAMIPRHLRQQDAVSNTDKIVSQDELRNFSCPLVILGEAGAGKTRLMQWLAESMGYALCTARRLCSTSNPAKLLNDTNTLVIDALDELSTQREGDSVDAVLNKLEGAGYPRFILSCRVADWRSASSTALIQEHYGTRVAELHLLPFDKNEARDFLSRQFGEGDAERIEQHLTNRGLDALLGNPQTLLMVAAVAQTGALPDSKTELFEQTITLLAREHRDERAEYQPSQADVLNAAGAACAALLLTGCEAITRLAAIRDDGDLPIADLGPLAPRDAIHAVLDSRLFRAAGVDRFTYLHRSIAEFLGARWLAQRCASARQRRRLLHALQGHGGVPSALRGIHAWLAAYPGMAQPVTCADPMGFIEYGDARNLSPNLARNLLEALRQLADQNPAFLSWNDFRVHAFLHPELQAEITALIATKDTPFQLRVLLLQAVRDDKPGSPFANELKRIALDPSEWYATRSAAGEALLAVAIDEDWPGMVDQLRAAGDEHSLRLGIEWMGKLDYEPFTDQQIVSMVRAKASEARRTVGALFMLQRSLPTKRIDGLLDLLSCDLGPFDQQGGGSDETNSTLTSFAHHLIARRLKAGPVEALQLWRWLRPYKGSRGYQEDTRAAVNEFLREHDQVRQVIQSHVMLDERSSQDPWGTAWKLQDCAAGLALSEADVIALLEKLDLAQTTAERWKAIVALARHDATAGAAVREAARQFANGHHEDQAWLDALPNPTKPQRQIDDEAREERHRAKRLQRLAQVKASCAPHIQSMKAGEIDPLIGPAQAYLGLFHDLACQEPDARVREMLGDEIGAAALDGFEAALQRPAQFPSVEDTVATPANSQTLNANFVLAAGLGERLRHKLGFGDLTDECILKGFVAIYQTALSGSFGNNELDDAIAASALDRGVWEQGIRARIEPQFSNLEKSVHELVSVMRDDIVREPATELALDWLQRFPTMPLMAEIEIVDRLIASQEVEALRSVWESRSQDADPARRRLWLAVGLLVDFERAAAALAGAPVEKELLWDLRARIKSERKGSSAISLTPAQAGWIISTFRTLWPWVTHPSDSWSGNTNAWDATEFIQHAIARLGNDLGPDAHRTLRELRDAPGDGYTDRIKIALAEQQQALIEASYQPMAFGAIQAIVTNQAPASIKDLQAFMLEELSVVQAKIKGDDAESWRGFFSDNGEPHDEERCRDHLLGLLRQGDQRIHLEPETHVASDKEVDITCRVSSLQLPIEIKGQWHRELWTAADQQLDKLYATDWQAGHHGIYLVLWFGDQVPENKRLKNLRGQGLPGTPDELREALKAGSTAIQQGRISIFVLDLERRLS